MLRKQLKRSRQKCIHCGKDSIPGMRRGHGLCQYHWNVLAYGKNWADKVQKGE